jgi:hypothetical protein
MGRIALSYMLTSVILLSQIGLPLHMHYCKGVLESVSLLANPGCQDHEEVALVSDCCKKLEAPDCPKQDNKCCDDEVTVLTQNITSVAPYLMQWVDIPFETGTGSLPIVIEASGVNVIPITVDNTSGGPPIYILHQALIYYA